MIGSIVRRIAHSLAASSVQKCRFIPATSQCGMADPDRRRARQQPSDAVRPSGRAAGRRLRRFFLDWRRWPLNLRRRLGHVQDDHQRKAEVIGGAFGGARGRHLFAGGVLAGCAPHPPNAATTTATDSHLHIMLQLSHIICPIVALGPRIDVSAGSAYRFCGELGRMGGIFRPRFCRRGMPGLAALIVKAPQRGAVIPSIPILTKGALPTETIYGTARLCYAQTIVTESRLRPLGRYFSCFRRSAG